MNDLIYKITEEVTESEDEFIFTTIKPWCEEVMQRKISKRDLEKALTSYFNGGSVRTGKWIKCNDDCFDWYECSECGYGDEGELEYSAMYDVRPNYCPHCGAKMESEI